MSLPQMFNNVTNIDYSAYEELLKKITSVKLQNISELTVKEEKVVEEQFMVRAETYFKKLKEMFQELSEEV